MASDHTFFKFNVFPSVSPQGDADDPNGKKIKSKGYISSIYVCVKMCFKLKYSVKFSIIM